MTKPTQEQLNDLKWWDNYGEDAIYCYYSDLDDGMCFTKELAIHPMYHLLGERPANPPFVPKVGTECEMRYKGWNKSWVNPEWSKVIITAIGEVMFLCKSNKANGFENSGIFSDVEFRPIKSERELFLDSVKKELPKADTDDLIFAGKLYDAGFIKDPTK